MFRMHWCEVFYLDNGCTYLACHQNQLTMEVYIDTYPKCFFSSQFLLIHYWNTTLLLLLDKLYLRCLCLRWPCFHHRKRLPTWNTSSSTYILVVILVTFHIFVLKKMWPGSPLPHFILKSSLHFSAVQK